MPFGIVLRKLLPREQQDDFDMDHATLLAEALTPRRSALVINHWTAKIPENSRLDSRNAAMSTVADLLCGNVDRHAANLAYQFDKNHKFIGV